MKQILAWNKLIKPHYKSLVDCLESLVYKVKDNNQNYADSKALNRINYELTPEQSLTYDEVINFLKKSVKSPTSAQDNYSSSAPPKGLNIILSQLEDNDKTVIYQYRFTAFTTFTTQNMDSNHKTALVVLTIPHVGVIMTDEAYSSCFYMRFDDENFRLYDEFNEFYPVTELRAVSEAVNKLDAVREILTQEGHQGFELKA